MPNRILREGILTSARIAKLGWAEEVFYRRLMSVVDDFGRYYADPGLLRAACFPRQLNKVSDSDLVKWIRATVEAGLVRVYPAKDGERYLELLDFRQQVRAKESKFPQPDSTCEVMRSTCVADAEQAQANAHLDVSVVGDEDGGVGEGGNARKRATPPERPEGVAEQVWTDWLALRKEKRAPVTPTVVESAQREAVSAGMSLEAFLRIWCARGSQGLQADWLKPAERAQYAPQASKQSALEARNAATVARLKERFASEAQ